MTPTFEIGEIAIGCNMQFDLAYNGRECEILEGIQRANVIDSRGLLVPVAAYWVRWANGEESYVEPDRLRRRPPESDDAAARQAMLDCIERAKMGQGATV